MIGMHRESLNDAHVVISTDSEMHFWRLWMHQENTTNFKTFIQNYCLYTRHLKCKRLGYIYSVI